MTMHNKPEFNPPKLVAAMKAFGLVTDKPSVTSDAFRSGWFAAQPDWEPQRCGACTCEFGELDCNQIKNRRRNGGTPNDH